MGMAPDCCFGAALWAVQGCSACRLHAAACLANSQWTAEDILHILNDLFLVGDC